MKMLMVETEPAVLGLMLSHIYVEYPKIKIHQQWGVNNVRVNAVKQPFQTVVMYLTYDLPNGDEIDQTKILELTKKSMPNADKPDIKSRLSIS